MSSIPAPPGGSEPPPPSETVSYVPPPPGSDEHVNDVLERRKKFSWRNFGGDGFLVSVAFHVLLAIIAIFYIVSRYKAPEKKSDPDVFATGAGGGANGEKPKAFEQKLQTRQTNVKMPARIASRSASAIALPDTPQTSSASFATGLTSGGMSKGSGGGSGGGEGTGIGIGKGGGRNFVSLFGARGANVAGLPGVFYDAKQTSKGKPTPYAGDDSADWKGEVNKKATGLYAKEVLEPFAANWSAAFLDKFFKAPEQLYASQIFIPKMQASEAPKAYGVEKQVRGSRWIAWYRGTVTAPKTGRFRFWGDADDAIAVRFNRRHWMAAGYHVVKGPEKKVDDKVDTLKGRLPPEFRSGSWFDVEKGKDYPIEIIISELPGGSFCAYLLMEEYDASKRAGDGKLFLFRMSKEPLPDGIKQDTGLEVDMSGKDLVWTAKGSSSKPAR